MKFMNVCSVITPRRSALRFALLSLLSFLCLMVFAMSIPRLRVAEAGGAAHTATAARQQQQKLAGGGKTGAVRAKSVSRESGKSAAKGAVKSSGDTAVQPQAVCAQNQPITFGQTINGTLASGDCLNPIESDNSRVDEYTFNGSAGQQVAVSMSAAFDTFLYLLRPDGTVLAVNDDVSSTSTDSRIPPTGFITLPTSGVYSILANSFRPQDGGAYTVTLTSGTTCNLTPIAFGETKTGTLSAGDCTNPVDEDGTPVDFYTFSGTAGQQISITLTTTSGTIDPYLYLLTPEGDLLADDDNGGGGTAARLPQSAGFGRLPVTGVYTIVVNTLQASQTGNYSLTLTKAATDCPTTPLAVGGTADGALANGDCRLLEDSSFIDAYTFTGTANQQVSVSMTSNTAGLVPVLFLLAPNGDALAIDVNADGDNVARIPAGTASFSLPAAGTYTILANSFATNQTGNYTLRLLAAGAACTTTLAATSRDVDGGGGQFTVGFTTQPGCTATATSNAGFITGVPSTITVDANGAGTVSYTVQANTTTATRTGTITINGQTFTVTQQGQAATCTYALFPTVRPFRADGGEGRLTVITQSNCAWTATSNAPWITLTPGFTTGTGTGRIRYTAAANNTSATRTGTVTVNGLTHTVTQTSAGTTPQLQFSGNAEFLVNENDPARAASITVTRTGDTAGAATVEYATIDDPAEVPCDPTLRRGDGSLFPQGTAYARCDYATTVDTLTFNPGETTRTLTIPLINDVFQEGNETFRIALSNPQGATLGTLVTATVTLQSDDLALPTTNPINQTPVFVRQQYLDFLDREPEAAEPWTAVLNRCGNIFTGPEVVTDCDRIAVSGAFFGSPEFRIKGLFVFLHYKAAFGSANNPLYVPQYVEFVTDARRVSGLTAEEVIAKRLDFSEDFLARTAVANAFAGTANDAFVDRVLSNLGITLANADPASGETRTSLVNALNAGTKTRAQVLRIIVESTEAIATQFNRAFVAIQYYGYLRRTPEPEGYQNNLNALNQTNNSRLLINGFLNSIEYRLRFGPNTAQ